MRLEQDVWPAASPTEWFISADCSELVGRSLLGEDVFQSKVDQNNWSRQNRNSGLVYAARMGQLLFVALGGQIMAIDSRQSSSDQEGDLLWQAFPMGRYSVNAQRGRRAAWTLQNRAGRSPVYHAFSDRKRTTDIVGAVVGSLGPVTPRGVVFQEQNQLKCVDPLSGETLWTRSDVPAGCELFGDREFVMAADVSEHEAHVVRMSDGQLVGKRPLPRSEWLLSAGRNIAQLRFRADRDQRAMLLTVTDIWSQKTLFDAEYPITSRTSMVEPHAVALYEPSGKFQLIDVRTGQAVIDQQLQSVPDLQSIQTVPAGDALYLIVSTQAARQLPHKPIGQLDYPIASGLVYAFGLKNGQSLWPGPATIRNRGMVSQPGGLPFLVFADRKMSNEAAGGGRWNMRLLCLDKLTGETVYRNDRLPDATVSRFRVRGQQDASRMVTMQTNAGTIQLAMTDSPRPPRPPANDDLEAIREAGERGLVGLGERMGAVLRGAIGRAPSNGGAPGVPADRPVQPPVDDAPQPMDDD